MIIKEAIAFEYQCPLKMQNDVFNKHCSGSSCMAWRWAIEKNPEWKPASNWLAPNEGVDPFIRSKTDGYCGMAGQA